MIVTRPIRFTDSMAAHRNLLETLGGRCLSDFGTWVVYAVGHGRIALHAADENFPAGQTTLGFETDDLHLLADAAAAAAPAGSRFRVAQAPHGTAVMVTCADGVTFTVDPLTVDDDAGSDPHNQTEAATTDAAISVLAMWLTDQPERAVSTMTAMGATVRLAADSGVWTDVRTDAGLVGVHDGSPTEVQINFEYDGDIEELIAPLARAGLEATMIDEAYTRTLRLPDPDLPEGQIWISERQRDLYGYRELG